MIRVYDETEHQELFYLDADLRQPVRVHIPSALGQLGYYVCLRLENSWVERLGGVVTCLKIGGLRPDDVTLKRGEGMGAVADRLPSKAPGQAWVLLCRASVSRGDGVVTFSGLPDGLNRGHLLLCTWPRFLESGQADDWIACQADPHWAPNGVPLGGIGGGKVEISRDGRFRNFSGNNNQDMPFEEPDGLEGAFLSVAADGSEKVLATRPATGLEPVPTLKADLAFPQVTLAAREAFPGVDASVLLSGPIVPQDVKTAALPGFVARWRVTNRRAVPVTVRCRLAWPNLVGAGGGFGRPERSTGFADGSYIFVSAPDAHTATGVATRAFRALRYTNAPNPEWPAADGAHWIAARKGAGRKLTADTNPRRGSVTVELEVPAGATATADMAMAWEMPHWIDRLGTDRGHYWQNLHTDGESLLKALFRGMDRILVEAGALQALLRETELPEWLTARLSNCCYPLVTNSVFYRDGRFSINEGPTEMTGCYGTLDQRLGAHPATQLLFPELNVQELGQFAAYQSPSGGVNHDFGCGHLESGPRDTTWPDLTCSFILQHARHAWSTGDAEFATTAWPQVKQALLRHGLWADAGNGVAQVGHASGLGTSYDGYHYEGTTPYMGTLWLATLLVSRRWAANVGDTELIPQIDRWLAAAEKRMEVDLWNGRYYRAYGSAGGPVNDNCHAGMLAGEYYARMLAGRDVLPLARLKACADAWFALNGNPRYGVPPDEVAPDGKSGAEFGWLPYVECFGVAPFAVLGDPRAMPVWECMVRHMQGDGKTPCDTRLMYQPVSGEPSWGAYYMTAPASWLVYDAFLDFFYAPREGVLRLVPQCQGAFAVVHPLFWAVGRRDGDTISLEVRRVFGRKALPVKLLEVPAATAGVTVGGTPLRRRGAEGCYARFALPRTTLKPGTVVKWRVEK